MRSLDLILISLPVATSTADLTQVPGLHKDIRDVTISDLKGFDAIIHLAALSNDPLSDLNPESTYEINHRASVRFAELAKAAGVPRFLFSSSCSLYGLSAGADFLPKKRHSIR